METKRFFLTGSDEVISGSGTHFAYTWLYRMGLNWQIHDDNELYVHGGTYGDSCRCEGTIKVDDYLDLGKL